MLFFILLLGIAVSAEGQYLHFNSSHVNQQLTIRCSLPDIQVTNMAHIVSLDISKKVNGAQVKLASVLSVGNDDPVTQNIGDGVVTSGLTWDGSQCYLDIQWPIVKSSMAGEYRCSLSGLTQDNRQVVLTSTLTLVLTDVEPTLVPTPQVIEVGLSRSCTLNCSVTSFSSLKLRSITTISLSYVHAGIDQLLASIDVFSGEESKPGSDIDQISGHLGSRGANYLAATWMYPDAVNAGDYLCDILGIDTSSSPVQFSRMVEVTSSDPTRELLLGKIKELDIAYTNASLLGDELLNEIRNISDQRYHYLYLYGNSSNDVDRLTNELRNETAEKNELAQQLRNELELRDFYVFVCTFENGFCGMNQLTTDQMDWLRLSGPTGSTDTGPSDDHTPESSNGYYIYLETSNGNLNDVARLETPVIPAHPIRSVCLRFWYHMYGSEINALRVYNKHGSTLGGTVWTASGDKGNQWLEGRTTLAQDSRDSTLVFEAVKGDGYEGDIAIDDVTVSDINC